MKTYRTAIVLLTIGFLAASLPAGAGDSPTKTDPASSPISRETPALSTTEPQTTPLPTVDAVFPEVRYEFSPVLEGDTVRHSYAVHNQGGADLNILAVRTG